MRRRTVIISGLAAGLASPRRSRAAGNPVVLELFTSQGCSSCPPADAFLGELARRPDVIALAWHVDYWNNLGWRDPFANRQWTERQRRYANYLREEVYTPAMVVNGSALVVGSDRRAVAQAMEQARSPTANVTLRRTASGLEAEVIGLTATANAVLAFYDPEHATAVGAGENTGRHLKEYRVVREAHETSVSGNRTTLPAIPVGQGAALLLRDANWHIIGAADLPPA